MKSSPLVCIDPSYLHPEQSYTSHKVAEIRQIEKNTVSIECVVIQNPGEALSSQKLNISNIPDLFINS